MEEHGSYSASPSSADGRLADSEPAATHTTGPWLRVGSTVYALQHRGWRNGEEQFCNRFTAHVQGLGTPGEELLAVARLMQAAPELLDAAIVALAFYDTAPAPHLPGEPAVLDTLSAAIAKAAGQS